MDKEQVITPFRKSGEFLTYGALQGAKALGERLVKGSPFHVPESPRHQEAIRQFDGRLGIVTRLIESEDAEALESRASAVARNMVDEGMVDPGSEVELRTLMPEEALRRGEFIQKTLASLGLLRHFLRTYEVEAIPNGFPIIPTKTAEAPVSSRRVWGAIGDELDAFRRQLGPRHKLAMLAIAEAPYAKRIFDDQPHINDQSRYLDDGQLMVVRSIGAETDNNILMPPRAASSA